MSNQKIKRLIKYRLEKINKAIKFWDDRPTYKIMFHLDYSKALELRREYEEMLMLL